MNIYDEDYNDPAKLATRIAVGGPIQSIVFTREAIRHLEAGGVKWHKFAGYSIHDYGCADGFGTAVLASEFPRAKVRGVDISQMYINRASELFPTLEWAVGDVTDPKDVADIIWTTHTLEHVKDPLESIRKLITKARRMVVVVVPPVVEGDSIHEGGMPTKDFLKRVIDDFKDSLTFDDNYLTFRWNVTAIKEEHTVLKEGNILLVFRGTAT